MQCNFLLTACVGFMVLSLTFGEKCDKGWTGKDCSLQCHCDHEPNCVTGNDCESSCKPLQFGPDCQYRDMLQKNDSKSDDHGLTDGDDKTCMLDEVRELTIDLRSPTTFTWIRFVTKGPVKPQTVSFELDVEVHKDGTVWQTSPIVITERIFDVYGGSDGRVKKIKLKWKNAADSKYFCSVYFSGGRNVALKQSTKQTTTENGFTSDKAVDGITTFPNCAVTQNDTQHSWSVDFTPNVNVDSLELFGEDSPTDISCHIKSTHVDIKNWTRALSDHYTNIPENHYHHLRLHAIAPDTYLQDVSTVRVHVRNNSRVAAANCTIPVLHLCEAKVYGDYACAPGAWGHLCGRKCGRCWNQACAASTGACLSGCDLGYTGFQCDQVQSSVEGKVEGQVQAQVQGQDNTVNIILSTTVLLVIIAIILMALWLFRTQTVKAKDESLGRTTGRNADTLEGQNRGTDLERSHHEQAVCAVELNAYD